MSFYDDFPLRSFVQGTGKSVKAGSRTGFQLSFIGCKQSITTQGINGAALRLLLLDVLQLTLEP